MVKAKRTTALNEFLLRIGMVSARQCPLSLMAVRVSDPAADLQAAMCLLRPLVRLQGQPDGAGGRGQVGQGQSHRTQSMVAILQLELHRVLVVAGDGATRKQRKDPLTPQAQKQKKR